MNASFILGLLAFGIVTALAYGKILIYTDAGVSYDMLEHLTASLERAGHTSYRLIEPTELRDGVWQMEVKLLIFPDGKDDCYGDALDTQALEEISTWANTGGNVLGIGAGAYFASKMISFTAENEIDVKREGPLPLYPYGAYGPVSQTHTRSWKCDPKPAPITITDGDTFKAPINMYAIGSCYFKTDEVELAKWKVLAKYATVEGTPPAIISGKVGTGEGKVLLSGPNWTADHEKMRGLEETSMYQELLNTSTERRKFAKKLLEYLTKS